MLATCHEHGIIPMVPFHPFPPPRWLAASGGWEAQDTPEKFARFCERAMAHLGDLIPLACTLNEVNGGPLIKAIAGEIMDSMRKASWFEAAARSVGSDTSRFVPMMFADSERGRETTLAAHRWAVEAIKAGRGNCEVGLTLAMQDIQAGPGGEEMAAQMRRELLDVYLEGTRGDDFIGVQTHSRPRFRPAGPPGPEEGRGIPPMGYEILPDAPRTTN